MALTILMTGGTGMVGHNVLDLAARRGIAIHAPSRAEMNLFDATAVQDVVAQLKPDIIIHAAGRVGGIAANMGAQAAFLTENFDMGRNVVMAAQAAGVPRLVNLGSSCMYPKDMDRPLREDDILSGPLEPTNEGYAIAKLAVASLCQYISGDSEGLNYKTLIPCNLFGRYDAYDPSRSHLAAAALAKLHHAKIEGASEVEVWGDGTVRREFLHAGDLADAILTAVDRFDTMPAIMNVGVGVDHSVNDFYRAAAKAVGYTNTFSHDFSRPAGMKRKLMDVTKARDWGWTASTSLEDGLKAAYAWYREEIAGVAPAAE
jgi:GDP-L-fucose synthase